jgi:catechol 2,3-dioxygenase-like lactoylglutathione lyase family enzyme
MIKLAHVCIESADLDATERFYACLGLKRQFEFRNPQGLLVGFYLKFDDTTFVEVIAVQRVREEGGVRHFAMETGDVDALCRALRAGGFEVSEPHQAGDHNRMATCRDPNGIFIELQQYGAASMQLHGGVCEVNYVPRPA